MRRAAGILCLLLAPLAAQTPARLTTGALAAPVAAAKIPQGMLDNLEKNFDSRLMAFDSMDPVDMLGGTRGLYIQGFGTVFTTEISLIVTPGNFPIARPTFTPEIRAQVHQRKMARLPKLQEIMKDMVKVTAKTLLTLPDDQRIILAVRLRYLPEEDTAGLPSQISMSADKKSALLGDIKTEIE